ncbi:lipoate-protein ligase b-like protein [Lasius niger]|uniref:Lipoate-protein ligase b-like protein n=1 Tax=Lasius niger TaxID=67767 RepID=A0A0J7JVH8_LASNI|nr:lipoate-protein ligase b-like protein [Lasius niger]
MKIRGDIFDDLDLDIVVKIMTLNKMFYDSRGKLQTHVKPRFAWKVANPCGTSLCVESCKPMWNLASRGKVYVWTQWVPPPCEGLHYQKTRHIGLG